MTMPEEQPTELTVEEQLAEARTALAERETALAERDASLAAQATEVARLTREFTRSEVARNFDVPTDLLHGADQAEMEANAARLRAYRATGSAGPRHAPGNRSGGGAYPTIAPAQDARARAAELVRG